MERVSGIGRAGAREAASPGSVDLRRKLCLVSCVCFVAALLSPN